MLSNKQHLETIKSSLIISKRLLNNDTIFNSYNRYTRLIKKKSIIYCYSNITKTPDIPSFLLENSIVFIGMPVLLIKIANRNYNRTIILPITLVKQ